MSAIETNVEEQPTARPASRAPVKADQPSWATLPVVLAPVFMISLDVFIVNVAVPAIHDDLRGSPATIQFLVSGFALAIAASLIISGRLGDLYGRRRMFSLGLLLFTAASAACGLSPTAGSLVASRVVQGLGAAMMAPQALAILGLVYTGSSRHRAFTAYGLAMGLAAVSGQLIGGLLTSADILGLGWRAIFLINVPIGLVVLGLMGRLVPESRATQRGRLDLLGTLLVMLCLVALLLPLIEGRQQDWPQWSWLCAAAGFALLGALVAYERHLGRRGRAPLLALSLFRRRDFSVGLAVTVVYYSAMASFFLVFTLYLQHGRGLTPLESGLVFTPLGAGFFGSSAIAGKLAMRLGRQTVAVGAVAVAAGYGLLAMEVNHIHTSGEVAWIIPALVIAGFGMGMAMANLTSLVLAGIGPEHAAVASGVLSTGVQLGNAFGVAVIGIVYFGADPRLDDAQGTAHAFVSSLVFLSLIAIGVALLVQFLSGRKPQRAAAADLGTTP